MELNVIVMNAQLHVFKQRNIFKTYMKASSQFLPFFVLSCSRLLLPFLGLPDKLTGALLWKGTSVIIHFIWSVMLIVNCLIPTMFFFMVCFNAPSGMWFPMQCML